MENLLRLLPSQPQPPLVRIGVSAILVVLFFIFRLEAGVGADEYGFIFYVVPILLSAIVFDRGSGFFATALSVAGAASLLDWRVEPIQHLAALALFIVFCCVIVIVGEGMRKALERQVAAQAEAELLLREQGHRIKNDLAIACSLITLQARGQKDQAARNALEDAAGRLTVLAKSYDHLRITTGDELTDMQQYLSEICWNLGEALRGLRPIAVIVDAAAVLVPSPTATRLGLIVNELVTNALKHAFPDDRAGTVKVELRSSNAQLVLVVEDDGVGCPENLQENLGSRLTRLLVQQLRGSISRHTVKPGCRVHITVPT
jgi:two-component sensor histidine kinase